MSGPISKLKKSIKNNPVTPPVYIAITAGQDHKSCTEHTAFCCYNVSCGIAGIPKTIHGRVAEDVKNEHIHNFLTLEKLKGYTHLYMLDADTCPMNPACIEKLLEADKDVAATVTPIYNGERMIFGANVVPMESGLIPSEPFLARYVGGTSILIKREVLEKLDYPYQETVRQKGKVVLSEDFNFCERIRKVGYEIWVYPDDCGHHWHTIDIRDVAIMVSQAKEKSE